MGARIKENGPDHVEKNITELWESLLLPDCHVVQLEFYFVDM